MTNFLITRLVSPFVDPTNHFFDKAAVYVASRNPGSSPSDISHDLKAVIHNAATTMIISVGVMGYLRIISRLKAALPLATAFYFLRRIILETMKQKETPLEKIVIQTISPPAVGSPLTMGSVIGWKSTQIPLQELLAMIKKRNQGNTDGNAPAEP